MSKVFCNVFISTISIFHILYNLHNDSGTYFQGFPWNGKKILGQNSCQNGTGSLDPRTETLV